MAERLDVYRCNICGHVVVVVRRGGGTLVCCNQPMEALTENTTDAAQEKHVPVIEKVNQGYTVKVGSVAHPMQADHFIEWIELRAGEHVCRQFLKPGDAPEATFETEAGDVSARIFCNLHSLWSGNV
ncbi:MAG TPA: desulfoferrodoxin [Candidatus Hydrogenedentes bacterium]|nr:desulfoferrodoxin [Candidatus Hydrogenedentota bacterium]